jgi:hypothetical protein
LLSGNNIFLLQKWFELNRNIAKEKKLDSQAEKSELIFMTEVFYRPKTFTSRFNFCSKSKSLQLHFFLFYGSN